jgi:1-deoxy-D-xylulose-5-phosphate reductoisomerase
MVTYVDGTTMAAASPPDMKLPIALALAWPDRVAEAAEPIDWTRAATWTFEPLDTETFTAVQLAREAGCAGGTAPAVFNAANEEAVAAFMAGRIAFLDIVDTIATVVGEHSGSSAGTLSLEDVADAERWARERAQQLSGGGA